MGIALAIILIGFAQLLVCGVLFILIFQSVRMRERDNDLQTQIDNLKCELVEVKGKLGQ